MEQPLNVGCYSGGRYGERPQWVEREGRRAGGRADQPSIPAGRAAGLRRDPGRQTRLILYYYPQSRHLVGSEQGMSDGQLIERDATRQHLAAHAVDVELRHPALLRHPGEHGERHLPGRRAARLRDAGGHSQRRHQVARRGAHLLHVELRHHRAAAGDLAQPGAPLRRLLRAGDGDHRHQRRQRGPGDRHGGAARHRRRGALPGPALRRLSGDRHARRRRLRPRADEPGERLQGPGRRPGGADNAAHEGDHARLSGQPDGRRDGPRRPAGRRRRGAQAQPLRRLGRDLRPAGLRDHKHTCVASPAGHARPDDAARRLLEGLRDDRLADRLRRRPRRPHRRRS